MIKVQVKPLSVNQAWKGRRYKTDMYKRFEIDCFKLLPRKIEIPEGQLAIAIEFGHSSGNSDFDNGVKPFVDILQKKYQFNDNRIKLACIVVNNDVKKGQEYIRFKIESYDKAVA